VPFAKKPTKGRRLSFARAWNTREAPMRPPRALERVEAMIPMMIKGDQKQTVWSKRRVRRRKKEEGRRKEE
jgi:hypothetical protein